MVVIMNIILLKQNMRKTAKQQVEEIEIARYKMIRFEIYMTLFLLELGIELPK